MKSEIKNSSFRVLVTGAAGFVGSHIVEHLLENTEWQIIGIDSFRHRGDTLRLPKDSSGRYTVMIHDLNAPFSYREMMAIGPLDYIINCASESHVDRSITDPEPFIQNNVNLMLHMLGLSLHQISKGYGLKGFYQVSTDEVYGPAFGAHLHKEWEMMIPSNPYAASKAAQEMIAIAYWRTYDVPIVITNTMNMIGERQDKEKYLPQLISKIHAGEKVIVHGSEHNVGSRFYLHARNFADALLFLMSNRVPTKYKDGAAYCTMPDRYNVVGELEIDNLSLARHVANILQKPLVFEYLDFHSARPGHDRRYALDGGKMSAMGWEPPVAFEDSLRRTIEWTLKNPIWLK